MGCIIIFYEFTFLINVLYAYWHWTEYNIRLCVQILFYDSDDGQKKGCRVSSEYLLKCYLIITFFFGIVFFLCEMEHEEEVTIFKHRDRETLYRFTADCKCF